MQWRAGRPSKSKTGPATLPISIATANQGTSGHRNGFRDAAQRSAVQKAITTNPKPATQIN
jgi:hypothetical protein